MRPALLVIDVQNRFFKINKACADSLNYSIEYINAALELFRKKYLPIFVIHHKSEEENLLPGTPDFEMSERLKLKPQDPHITKTYGNSFAKTGLAEKLRGTGSGHRHCDRLLRRILHSVNLQRRRRSGFQAHNPSRSHRV